MEDLNAVRGALQAAYDRLGQPSLTRDDEISKLQAIVGHLLDATTMLVKVYEKHTHPPSLVGIGTGTPKQIIGRKLK